MSVLQVAAGELDDFEEMFLDVAPPSDLSMQAHTRGRIAELTVELLGAIKRHMLPPTALGMRKSSLVHKVSAILHSLYLELRGMPALRLYLKTIVNVTTDLGTESGVGDVPAIDIEKFLPQFQSVGYCSEESMGPPSLDMNDADAPAQGQPWLQEAKFMFENSLSLAGVLHNLHGACKELTDAMPHFSSFFFDPFKALVDVLGHEEFRKYLVKRCYSTPVLEGLAPQLLSFDAQLVEHRWGYIISAAKAVHDLEYVLSAGWNVAKLTKRPRDGDGGAGGPGAAAAAAAEDGAAEDLADDGLGHGGDAKKGSASVSDADIRKATEFVTCAGRWAYLKMLLLTSQVIEMFTAWFESCPCHPSRLLGVSGASWNRRYRAFISEIRSASHGVGKRSEESPCPMKGRQAWRVAKGVHWELVNSWWQAAVGHLVGVVSFLFNVSHKSWILGDFDCGRLKLTETLQTKLAYTRNIPFKLAILCDPDQVSARNGYRECLQQFASFSSGGEDHRLSVKFCHPSGLLYSLGIQFMNGADIKSEAMRPLRSASVQHFHYLMFVERSAERNHALAHMNILTASNHTEAYFSLGIRNTEIERQLDDPDVGGTDFIAKLGSNCEFVRNPMNLAKAFDLQTHSAFEQAVAAGGKPQKLLEILRPMVYRCDAATQHAELEEATIDINAAKPHPVKASSDINFPEVLHKAATEHIRQVCQLGVIMSVDSASVGMPIDELRSRLSPVPGGMNVKMVRDVLRIGEGIDDTIGDETCFGYNDEDAMMHASSPIRVCF